MILKNYRLSRAIFVLVTGYISSLQLAEAFTPNKKSICDVPLIFSHQPLLSEDRVVIGDWVVRRQIFKGSTWVSGSSPYENIAPDLAHYLRELDLKLKHEDLKKSGLCFYFQLKV